MASLNSDASPPRHVQLRTGVSVDLLLPLVPLVLGLPALNGPDHPRDVAVFLNPPNSSITLMEGAIDDETVLRETAATEGSFPATRASIESLPRVKVSETGLECSICLAEYEVNAEVNEMPCGHRFDPGCIGRWLGIRGSCPVCRFRMPMELHKVVTEREGYRIRAFYPETGMDRGQDNDGVQVMEVE